jgi:hypothetical protein
MLGCMVFLMNFVEEIRKNYGNEISFEELYMEFVHLFFKQLLKPV